MLNHLYLAGNVLQDAGAEMLASGLRHNEQIIELDLKSN